MAPAAKHLLLLSTVLLAQQAIAQFDYNTTLLGTVTTFINVSTIPGEWLQAASIVPAVRRANIKTCIASACSVTSHMPYRRRRLPALQRMLSSACMDVDVQTCLRAKRKCCCGNKASLLIIDIGRCSCIICMHTQISQEHVLYSSTHSFMGCHMHASYGQI